MELFVSTYRAKIDSNLRASVPAAFRACCPELLVFAYCSLTHGCITVCTPSKMQEMCAYIESLDAFSTKREAMETIILGGSEQLHIDAKGRITLSERLIEFAGIGTDIAFVGKGRTFEIWSVDKLAIHIAKAREHVLSQKFTWEGN
ncbi:MAG: hypothetical protein JSS50_01190 [Proteobacteria bacterium]|nr:hypothetical protein [Pseudomonadota bacterium]